MFGGALLSCSNALAQNAGEILSRSDAVQRKLAMWDVEVMTIHNAPWTTDHMETSERFVRLGDKSRTEGRNSATSISDGTFTWTYFPGNSEYLKHPSAIRVPVLWVPYSSHNARVLREESLTIGEQQFPCWVIDLPSQPRDPHLKTGPATVWIDKSTYLPLKQTSFVTATYPGRRELTEVTVTHAITKISFEQPADSLFQPELPADAVEVKQLGVPRLKVLR
jgi:outer membrane lipoprotein-sorting protein